MSNFDSNIFGQNLKKYRKLKGLSQEDLAVLLCKTKATISKYELGEVLMNAEDISLVCDVLGIYTADLFDQEYKNINKEDNKNPFKTDKLYMYFYAYDYKKREFGKGKYILKITERPDFVMVDYCIPGDNKVYMRGYMNADKSVAFISFQNYEPVNARLDHALAEINIANGTDRVMKGTLVGTNSQYLPSMRKCYFSKKDIEFTDEMLEELKPSKKDIEMLNNVGALYIDIFDY